MILFSPPVFLRPPSPDTHKKTKRGGDQRRVDTADVIHTWYNPQTRGRSQRGGEEGVERLKEKAKRWRRREEVGSRGRYRETESEGQEAEDEGGSGEPRKVKGNRNRRPRGRDSKDERGKYEERVETRRCEREE